MKIRFGEGRTEDALIDQWAVVADAIRRVVAVQTAWAAYADDNEAEWAITELHQLVAEWRQDHGY